MIFRRPIREAYSGFYQAFCRCIRTGDLSEQQFGKAAHKQSVMKTVRFPGREHFPQERGLFRAGSFFCFRYFRFLTAGRRCDRIFLFLTVGWCEDRNFRFTLRIV